MSSTLDAIYIAVIIIVLAITFPIIYSYISPMLTSLTSSNDFSDEATAPLQNFNSKLPKMMDNMFLIILIFSWIGLLILSFLIDSHPIFFGISVVFILIVLYASVFLGNYAEDLINQNELTLAKANMPVIYFVASHILEFMIAISFTMLLALYGKSQRGGF